MDFPTLVRTLGRTLQQPLPGVSAQLRMAPRPRPGWDPHALPDDARTAAAMLLFYPQTGGAKLLLTLRPAHLPQHGGQVSLPGGAIEPGEDATTAALRETREEVGVESSAISVLGPLTPLHIPVSHFVLYPMVGVSETRPVFQRSPREVERLIELPVERLCHASTLAVGQRERRDTVFEVPYFAVDGERVWGATAMVLAELLCLLGCPPDPWGED